MKIPCAIYRDGTSKPVFFLEDDLPKDAKKRDAVVLEAFGTPDIRHGLGGADPLTSKFAYIGAPTVRNTDINYTFGYVGIANPVIDYTGNRGNRCAAAGRVKKAHHIVDSSHLYSPENMDDCIGWTALRANGTNSCSRMMKKNAAS
jgi:hypothetical protein